MTKIRINELARELEVKPNVILELLPELGVTDKKTHSSSLDDDLALMIRRHLGGANGAAPAVGETSEPAPHFEVDVAPSFAPEPSQPQPVARTEPEPPKPAPPKEAPKEAQEDLSLPI